MFLHHAHGFLHRALELWVMSSPHFFRPVLNVDVGRHAFVFNRPAVIARKEPTARCNSRTAIDENRRICRMDQPTPCAFADQQSNLSIVKHIGHEVAAGPGHFVNDHYLRSPNACGGTGERITITGDVIEVAVKVALQNIDDIVSSRSAAVVALINNRAFFFLRKKEKTMKTAVPGLTVIGKKNERELAVE